MNYLNIVRWQRIFHCHSHPNGFHAGRFSSRRRSHLMQPMFFTRRPRAVEYFWDDVRVFVFTQTHTHTTLNGCVAPLYLIWFFSSNHIVQSLAVVRAHKQCFDAIRKRSNKFFAYFWQWHRQNSKRERAISWILSKLAGWLWMCKRIRRTAVLFFNGAF